VITNGTFNFSLHQPQLLDPFMASAADMSSMFCEDVPCEDRIRI